jgi:phospholipase/lecithinase/hemolysin
VNRDGSAKSVVRNGSPADGGSRILVGALCGLLATALVALTAPATSAATYSKLVVFGDSLSDVGNEHAVHGNVTPPNYYGYRNSNGPLWVDDLAAKLGEPSLTNSLSGGSDFAYGGATASNLGTWVPNLGSQVSTYLAGGADSNALYIVWAGANDFLDTLATIAQPNAGKSAPSTSQVAACQTNAGTWAGYVSSAVGTLHAAGAVNFLVPNLPPLGSTPALNSNSTAIRAGVDSAVSTFNSTLSADLSVLEGAHPDLKVQMLDVYSLLNQVVAHPSDYGFTNATDACYPPTGVSSSKYGEYVFWDYIHPTTAAHAVLGEAAAQIVAEPATFVLAILGVAGLLGYGCWRRRHAAGSHGMTAML